MKTWQESGGGAFPFFDERAMNTAEFGMSLRDYFAAKAMQSLVTAHASAGRANNAHDLAQLTESAYIVADAMLAERAK